MSNAYKKSRDDVGPDGGFFITVNILFKQRLTRKNEA